MEFNKAFLSWKKRLRAVCITVIVFKSITFSDKHFIKATFGTAFSFLLPISKAIVLVNGKIFILLRLEMSVVINCNEWFGFMIWKIWKFKMLSYFSLSDNGGKGTFVSEVESRTQHSIPRPRTQKKSEAKDRLFEDRTSRGQEQK